MKKRLPLCLVLALLLSLLATQGQASQAAGRTIITGTTSIPDITIEVVVPAAGNVYINPKRLPVKIGADVEDRQIISEPFYIQNQSDVPIQADVEVTGSVNRGSDILLVAESTANSTAVTKRVFMYFEMQTVDSPGEENWAGGYDAEQHIVVRESTKTVKNLVILGAADQDKCYGAFRLTGDCIENPRDEWNSKDGVTVEIVFTFAPLPVGTEVP